MRYDMALRILSIAPNLYRVLLILFVHIQCLTNTMIGLSHFLLLAQIEVFVGFRFCNFGFVISLQTIFDF